MTAVTCEDLVTAAYRDAEIIMEDEDPEAEQAVRGLSLLQRLYKSLFTGGGLGKTIPRLITGNYTAEEQAAVTVESGTPTVTMPSVIASSSDPLPYGMEYLGFDSGTIPAGVDSANRAPRDLSVVEQASATTPSLKVYDAQAKTWWELLGLTLTSDAPLAGRWEDELTALLAERLARDPSPRVTRAAARARAHLAMNVPLAHTPTQAEYF